MTGVAAGAVDEVSVTFSDRRRKEEETPVGRKELCVGGARGGREGQGTEGVVGHGRARVGRGMGMHRNNIFMWIIV